MLEFHIEQKRIRQSIEYLNTGVVKIDILCPFHGWPAKWPQDKDLWEKSGSLCKLWFKESGRRLFDTFAIRYFLKPKIVSNNESCGNRERGGELYIFCIIP